MMGQTIKSGTGLCNIMMDEDYLLKELKSQDSFEDEFDEIDEDNIDILMGEDTKGDGCDDNDFKFSFE